MVLFVGTSDECERGMHQECRATAGTCRCVCHRETQELLRKQVIDKPRGPKAKVARATRGKKMPGRTIEALPAKVTETEIVVVEPKNKCPKCEAVYPAGVNFCRRDGAKLWMGKFCQRCEASCDAGDGFCWNCGWKLAEALELSVSPAPAAAIPSRVNPMPPMDAPSFESRRNFAAVDGDPMQGRPAPLPPGIQVVDIPSVDETEPADDPLLRLQRIAKERGLLPETTAT